MATLASTATGNFTAAATWAVCDTTSENDSMGASPAATTSFVQSSGFTPGAITIDALGLKFRNRLGSTGTFTCRLWDNTAVGAVAGTTTTINMTDINNAETQLVVGQGWYFFKFAAPVTLVAGHQYMVEITTSNSGQINVFASSGTDWSRLLRTTTTAAPGAGDKLFITGEHTGAGTFNTNTVTMDNTATTAFGIMHVCSKGVLTFGTTASTNYYLKQNGLLVYGNGTLNIGTTGTRIPSSSTAVLEFNSASAGQYGLQVGGGGACNIQGFNKAIVKTLMTADKAAAATVIGGLTATTDWAVGDELAFPTTTRTSSECEKKTILTVDSSSQVTLSAGLTNAHSGTSPTQAEVANITRNVKIRGVNATTGSGYVVFYDGSIVDIDYTEFYQLGSSGTVANKNGVQVNNSNSVCSIRYSSFHDSTQTSNVGVQVGAGSGSVIEVSDNVFYNLSLACIYISAANSGVAVFDNNLMIRVTLGNCIDSADNGSTFTNNKAVGASSAGFNFITENAPVGTFSGNTAHGCTSVGFNTGNVTGGTLSNTTAWRNSAAVQVGTTPATQYFSTVYDGIVGFGNNTAGLNVINGNMSGNITFKNLVFNGGTTLVQSIGVRFSSASFDYFSFENCTFGVTTGHTNGDIQAVGMSIGAAYFYNCTFASSTDFNSPSAIQAPSLIYAGIVSHKHNGVAGAVKVWGRFGNTTTDTAIYDVASPSLRAAPITASFKMPVANKIIPVASGATVTVSVRVRKSVVGDGTAYNGAQPRLMLRKNLELGITADTVLATAAAAAGTWETLTATTAAASVNGAFEFFVDLDGTTGWVNVDNFTTMASLDSTDFKYWLYGYPVIGESASGGSSGGSSTFC